MKPWAAISNAMSNPLSRAKSCLRCTSLPTYTSSGSQTASISHILLFGGRLAPTHLNRLSAISNSFLNSATSLSLAFNSVNTVISRSRNVLSSHRLISPNSGNAVSLIKILAPGFKAGISDCKIFTQYGSLQLWKMKRKKYTSASLTG